MNCKKCGADIPYYLTRCPKCGEPKEQEKAPTAQPPQPSTQTDEPGQPARFEPVQPTAETPPAQEAAKRPAFQEVAKPAPAVHKKGAAIDTPARDNAPPVETPTPPPTPERAEPKPAAPKGDKPDAPIYKEVTVGADAKRARTKAKAATARPRPRKRRPAPLGDANLAAGLLMLFAGVLLVLLYANYFAQMLQTAIGLLQAIPLGELMSAYPSTVADYGGALLIDLLAIVAGVMLIIGGNRIRTEGSGKRLAQVALIFQGMVLINYIVRWVLAIVITYAGNTEMFSPLSVIINLLIEVALIVQVVTALRLHAEE